MLYRAGAADPWAWFAVPEFVAALAFGGWVLVVAVDRTPAITLEPIPSR